MCFWKFFFNFTDSTTFSTNSNSTKLFLWNVDFFSLNFETIKESNQAFNKLCTNLRRYRVDFFWCLKLTFIYNLKTNRRHENHSGRRPENFNLKSSHNDFTKSPVNSSKLIFVWGNSRYLRGSPRPFSGSKAIILVIYNRFLKNIFSRTRSFLNKKYRKKFVINWCHPSWTNQKL